MSQLGASNLLCESKQLNGQQKRLKVYRFCHAKNLGGGTRWAQQLLRCVPHISVDDISTCDIVVCDDITTNDNEQNEIFVHQTLKLVGTKPTIFFVHDDPEEPMKLILEQPASTRHQILMFRTSLVKCFKQPYERILPSFQAADNNIKCLQPATCSSLHKPKIGFCGVMKYPARRMLCEAFQNNDSFDTIFVERYDFHGHFTADLQDKHKEQFLAVMNECPYQVCSRGFGNFSHRLYETLAFGRIPIVLDTQTCFPENLPSSMTDCIVFVRDIKHACSQLLAFHETHDLHDTQRACRKLWENFLSFEGFAPFFDAQMHELVAL